MLIEFSWLNVFRFIAELKQKHDYECLPAGREGEENEMDEFCDNRVNLNFVCESLCLR